jgi:hypothetical protein
LGATNEKWCRYIKISISLVQRNEIGTSEAEAVDTEREREAVDAELERLTL